MLFSCSHVAEGLWRYCYLHVLCISVSSECSSDVQLQSQTALLMESSETGLGVNGREEKTMCVRSSPMHCGSLCPPLQTEEAGDTDGTHSTGGTSCASSSYSAQFTSSLLL